MIEITGKIADIRPPYKVVINKGYEDEVREGMRFVIYDEGEELLDPDTHKPLGKFEYVKAKVKVTYVREKYSVAETYNSYSYESPSPAEAMTLDFFKPRTITEREKLPLEDEAQEKSPEQQKKLVVKKGDLVRQILD